jgi:hypothetical protein
MTLETTGETVELAAKGTTTGINVVAKTLESGIKKLEHVIDPSIAEERKRAIEKEKDKATKPSYPEPYDINGDIQQPKKSGYS